MNCRIAGMGAWGPGISNVADLGLILSRDSNQLLEQTLTPGPERIPPRERRRSPLAVKLAVEVAGQACVEADREPAELACVFASGMGDTQITDYMCRALDSEDKLLSPTRFHNSVHNAPAGYWSISTGCRQPTNSVCAFIHTFPIALLEATAQVVTEQIPVLLVVQDVIAPSPFQDVLAISDSFAAAFVLEPGQSGLTLRAESAGPGVPWPALDCASLESLYQTNPAARSLALIKAIANGDCSQLSYPLGVRGRLALSINS